MLTFDTSRMETTKDKGLSTRKSNKPLIEKRRRARINESLRQLKEIIVQERQLDVVRCNRLEKADILEMTVDYIKHVSREESSVSCLQNAYELGVERCVQEMFEFMTSQRDAQETSMTQKLANHCRKMLQCHAHTKELIQQLAANKRPMTSKLDTVADSSTSPKRHRLDDENEYTLSTCGENDLTDSEVQMRRETPILEAVSSTRCASEVSLLSESCEESPSLPSVSFISNSSPDAFVPNTMIQTQAGVSCTSSTPTDESVEIFPHVNIAEPLAEQSAKHAMTSHVQNIHHAVLSGRQQDAHTITVAAMDVGQESTNQFSKPIVLTSAGNVVIFVDRNAILPQVVSQNVIPAMQNTITLVPTPVMYKPTNNPILITDISLQKPSTCSNSGNYQFSHPQQQFIGQTVTNMPQTCPAFIQNGGIIVKYESENKICLPHQEGSQIRYMLLPQHHQNASNYETQYSRDTCKEGSLNCRYISSEGSQDVPYIPNQNSQSCQYISNQSSENVQKISNDGSFNVQDISSHPFRNIHSKSKQIIPNFQDTSNQTLSNVQDVTDYSSQNIQNACSQKYLIFNKVSGQTSLQDSLVSAQISQEKNSFHEDSATTVDITKCSTHFKQISKMNTVDQIRVDRKPSLEKPEELLPTAHVMVLPPVSNVTVIETNTSDSEHWAHNTQVSKGNERTEQMTSSATMSFGHTSLDISAYQSSSNEGCCYKSWPQEEHNISHENPRKSNLNSYLSDAVQSLCVSESSDNRGSDMTMVSQSYSLHQSGNVTSCPTTRLLGRSTSDDQTISTSLQELDQVLDLSRKFEHSSSKIIETITAVAETDINNNNPCTVNGERMDRNVSGWEQHIDINTSGREHHTDRNTSWREHHMDMISYSQLSQKSCTDLNSSSKKRNSTENHDCVYQSTTSSSNIFSGTDEVSVWRPWGVKR